MLTFEILADTIHQTHAALQQSTMRALNYHLTLRNWLIGFYIFEFEQKGQDRAAYGEKLLPALSKVLAQKNVSNVHERELRRYRLFYRTYLPLGKVFEQTLLENTVIQGLPFWTTLPIRGTLSPELEASELKLPPEVLLKNLSFSHLSELTVLSDPLQRTFYELESIKGCWGIRELKRQIDTAYFERSGLSQNPAKLSEMVQLKAEKTTSSEIVKSVYVFEFLGLKGKEAVEERDLESALLDHLQTFLLELGHGFCFEARQKRILIGDDSFFIDLVFYHRVLKCHVLVELKVESFNHTNAGQLNTYLNYYKKEMMLPDDNPPVGILMVLDKNQALVEYATAGMDNLLFVSKYLLKLPSKQLLEEFIKKEIKKF
jgi:predicted nuclease of restriction endonuclease-like (RecB) superfamily